MTQVHLYIKGDVVGVGYRAWLRIQAKINRVNGWVRNSFEQPDIFGPNGGVEAVLQGEEGDVEKLIELCKKGPTSANVDDVEVILQEVKEQFSEFEIRK
jgi:acylphosphatase